MSHAHAKTIIHILLFTISSLYSSQTWSMIQILDMLSSAKKARSANHSKRQAPTNGNPTDQQASSTNNNDSGQQTPTNLTPPTTHNSSISVPRVPSRTQESREPLAKIHSLLKQCIGQTPSCALQRTHSSTTMFASTMFALVAGIIEYVFMPLRSGELVLVKKNEKLIYGLIKEIHDNGRASVIVDYKVYGLMQRIDPTAPKAASRIADYTKECIKNIPQTEITRFSPPKILRHKKILFNTKKDDEEDNDELSEEDDDELSEEDNDFSESLE